MCRSRPPFSHGVVITGPIKNAISCARGFEGRQEMNYLEYRKEKKCFETIWGSISSHNAFFVPLLPFDERKLYFLKVSPGNVKCFGFHSSLLSATARLPLKMTCHAALNITSPAGSCVVILLVWVSMMARALDDCNGLIVPVLWGCCHFMGVNVCCVSSLTVLVCSSSFVVLRCVVC